MRTPRRVDTQEKRQRLRELRNELELYRWNGQDDMMTHIRKVNEMIQEIIFSGHIMPVAMRVIALRTTLPIEWHGVIDRLWAANPNSYQSLGISFLNEYISRGIRKTSTLAMNGSWRRHNAPWRRGNGIPRALIRPAFKLKDLPDYDDFVSSFPVFSRRYMR